MQKFWQWIRDKKTNTVRKWRSINIIGHRSASTNIIDDPFEDGRYFVSNTNDSTHLLSVHAYDSNRLRLGTSDSVLQRGASRSKRAIQQLQRKLTPTRRMRNESNGVARRIGSTSILKPSSSNDIDYRRQSNNELRQLLMEEDDSYKVCSKSMKTLRSKPKCCFFDHNCSIQRKPPLRNKLEQTKCQKRTSFHVKLVAVTL
jgi:hypothetical protein